VCLVSFLGLGVSGRINATCSNATNCTVDVANGTLVALGSFVEGCSPNVPWIGSVCFQHDQHTGEGYLIAMGQKTAFENMRTRVNGDLYDKFKPDICIDDQTILEYLLNIPAFANYTQIILDVEEAVGCLPGGLIQLCLHKKSLTCYEIIVQLLYFESWCVFKGVYPFGICKLDNSVLSNSVQ